MTLYNTATWIVTILVAAMLIFIAVAFQHAPPGQQNGNFYGKISDMPASPGLSTGPGLKQKDFK